MFSVQLMKSFNVWFSFLFSTASFTTVCPWYFLVSFLKVQCMSGVFLWFHFHHILSPLLYMVQLFPYVESLMTLSRGQDNTGTETFGSPTITYHFQHFWSEALKIHPYYNDLWFNNSTVGCMVSTLQKVIW